MKPLYNDTYETETPDGRLVSHVIMAALGPVIEDAVKNNYSLRHLNEMIGSVGSCMVSEAVLKRNMEIHRQEREARNTPSSEPKGGKLPPRCMIK
jgi:hypothetical protein